MAAIPELVTDRTSTDAERVRALKAKGYAALTPAERAEYMNAPKGGYNYQDRNRVESAVKLLSDTLRGLPTELRDYAASLGVAWDAFFEVPYDPSRYSLDTRTDWTDADIPTSAELARYLNNVKALRSALAYDTDALPDTMARLTVDGANAIEKALAGLDAAIDALRAATERDIDLTAASWWYSGEIFSGEV